jgi:hypothetical protein
LVIFSIANVDELEIYIAQSETTLCQAQKCLAMVTFEKQEATIESLQLDGGLKQ